MKQKNKLWWNKMKLNQKRNKLKENNLLFYQSEQIVNWDHLLKDQVLIQEQWVLQE